MLKDLPKMLSWVREWRLDMVKGNGRRKIKPFVICTPIKFSPGNKLPTPLKITFHEIGNMLCILFFICFFLLNILYFPVSLFFYKMICRTHLGKNHCNYTCFPVNSILKVKIILCKLPNLHFESLVFKWKDNLYYKEHWSRERQMVVWIHAPISETLSRFLNLCLCDFMSRRNVYSAPWFWKSEKPHVWGLDK